MQPTPLLPDGLPQPFRDLLGERFELIEWDQTGQYDRVVGVITYAHPPADGPLMDRMPRLKVIIAPHLGSASNRTRQRMMEMTIKNLEAALEGRELPYFVRWWRSTPGS